MSGLERLNSANNLTCPHCGSPFDPSQSTQWNVTEWKLTTQFGFVVLKSKWQAKIFDLLWRKQGIRGLTRERILDIVFMDDIDGGPEIHAIGKHVREIRLLVVNVGIFLKRGFAGGEGYSLVFTTPENAALQVKQQVEKLRKK